MPSDAVPVKIGEELLLPESFSTQRTRLKRKRKTLMNRFTVALHRAIALSILCILLAAPAALAQPAPDPEAPQSTALTPVSAAPPAAAFDRAADVPAAPTDTAPAAAGAPEHAAANTPQAGGDDRWDDRFGVPGQPDRVTALEVAPDGALYAGVGLFTS